MTRGKTVCTPRVLVSCSQSVLEGAWLGCATCQEIGALVYELYGLTEAEIAIVEEAQQ